MKRHIGVLPAERNFCRAGAYMTVELLLTVPARLWNFFQYASIQRIVIQRIVIVFLGYVFSEWGPKRVLENALSTAFCTRAHGYKTPC